MLKNALRTTLLVLVALCASAVRAQEAAVPEAAQKAQPDFPGQGLKAPRLNFTTKVATGVRIQDFRKGVPDALHDGGLPNRLTVLANPYLPDDRRIFKVWAMAPHPKGAPHSGRTPGPLPVRITMMN